MLVKNLRQNHSKRILYKILSFTVLTIICGWCLQSFAVHAMQELVTYTSDGHHFIKFVIYDEGEVMDFEEDSSESAWTIGAQELRSLQTASDYWAVLLGDRVKNTQLLTIYVGTDDEQNAWAESYNVEYEPYGWLTKLQAGVLYGYTSEKPLAYIMLGYYDEQPHEDYYGAITVLPGIDGTSWHTSVVLAHELGHAFGISTTALQKDLVFNTHLNSWDQYLVDSFGNAAEAGMEIIMGDMAEEGKFVLKNDDGYAFFQGPQVLSVLDGAILDPDGEVLGMPINGFEDMDEYGVLMLPELSHIELKNSFMSHQGYRNYGVFMEAELAALNDMGYEIDLSNHYGYSLYASDRDIVNTNGFGARNEEGTAYLPGEYNFTPLTVGLHIYGANNKVTQAADILSAGFGSVGARIDGYDAVTNSFGNNHFTIASGVKIHALGEQGVGVMVAYGKNQVVVNRGEVVAWGKDGIGASFDFGDNLMGNTSRYWGSYIWVEDGDNFDPEYFEYEGLDGALVSRFDLSGMLAGDKAAIYISENAFVENINIMQGAQIYGDIVSDWDPYAEFVQHDDPASLMTNLVFGLKADANGEATAVVDDDFYLDYQGDISGSESFDITLAGGRLQYGGSADVHSFTVNDDAALVVAVGANGLAADIKAESVDFESGSGIEVISDAFSYNFHDIALGAQTILSIDADVYTNNAILTQTDKVFAVGPYDYFYNAYWQDGQTRLTADVTGRSFNNARGGTLAVTAPLAIFAYNNTNDTLLGHIRQQTGNNSENVGALWIDSGYNYAKHGGSHKYNIKSPGVTVGGDVWLTDKLFLGAALSFEWPRFKSDDADIDARNITGALYGGALLPWEIELGAFAAYGRSHYDQTRKVADERFKTTYNSDNISLGVEVGRTFGLGDGGFTLRPFASYEFLHLETDGNKERGGEYALSFDDYANNLHRLNAGLDLTYVFENGASINGRVYYAGLYGQRRGKTTAFFSNDPALNTFTAAGLALDQNSIGASVGFVYPVGDTLEFNGGYNFLGGAKNQAHQFNLGVTFNF